MPGHKILGNAKYLTKQKEFTLTLQDYFLNTGDNSIISPVPETQPWSTEVKFLRYPLKAIDISKTQ